MKTYEDYMISSPMRDGEEIRNFFEDKEKEEICKQFVEICKTGTSHDCSVFVAEAKRKGVSYETLCEYKRNKERGELK